MDDGGRRRLIVLAVPDGDADFTAGLAEQVELVRSWWHGSGLDGWAFELVMADPPADREAVADFVRRAGLRVAGPAEVLVVFVAGHGLVSSSGRHFLKLPGTDALRLDGTAFRTSDLIAAALDSLAEHVLVIVSACYAEAVQADLTAVWQDLSWRRRAEAALTVVAGTAADEAVQVRVFTEVLQRAREQLLDSAGITEKYLSAQEFAKELGRAARRMGLGKSLAPRLLLPTDVVEQRTLALPNPGYRAPDRLVGEALREVAQEWARWALRPAQRTVVARDQLSTALARFLEDGRGTLVLAGAAGSGKSLLLSRLVALSDPALRSDPRYAGQLAAQPEPTLPPAGSVDVAVHARNREVAELLVLLLEGLGQTPLVPGGGDRIGALREQLLAVVAGAGRTVALVLDGIDEARSPYHLTAQLLVPLAARARDGSLRLLLGMRTGTGESVLDRLLDRADILRTDGPGTETQIARMLGDRHPGRAAELAHRATPSFLEAALLGRSELTADHLDWPDTGSPSEGADDAAERLARLTAALAAEIRSAASAEVPAELLYALLRSSALAPGAGIPWAEVWPAAAAALLGHPEPVPDTAVHHLLDSPLAGLLARGTEDRRTVYRPRHERLAAALRHGLDLVEAHRRIALALLATARPGEPPHPYVARRLAQHAELGGVLDDEHLPPWLLVHDTSSAVRGLLGLPVMDRPAQLALSAWARIEPFLDGVDLPARTASLCFSRFAVTGELLELPGTPVRPLWSHWGVAGNVLTRTAEPLRAVAAFVAPDGRPLLATGGADGAVRVWDPAAAEAVGEPMTGHQGGVRALAAYELADGRVLLATGGEDGTVRRWDPLTGSAVGSALTGHRGAVLALTVYQNGGPRLATGGEDGVVQVWDGASEARLAALRRDGTQRWVRALAAHQDARGRPVLAVAENDSLWLWDREHGCEHLVADEHHESARALLSVSQYPPVLAIGGDGRLFLRLATGAVQLVADDPREGWVRALTLAGPLRPPLPGERGERGERGQRPPTGRPLLLARVGDSGRIALTDLGDSPRTRRLPTGHEGGALGLAAYRLDGRDLLATVGNDGTLRISDPRREDRLSARQELTDLRYVRVAGRLLLAVSGSTRRVGLWLFDPRTGEGVGMRLAGITHQAIGCCGDGEWLAAITGRSDLWLEGSDGSLRSVATGHPRATALTALGPDLLATGGSDHTIRLWNPHTLECTAELPDTTWPRALARYGDRLAATGDDGSLRLWNLATRTAVTLGTHPSPGRALAVLPHGVLATGHEDGAVRLWHPERAAPVLATGHRGPVRALAALRNGLLAGGGEDGTVRFWDPAAGRALLTLVTGAPVLALACDPDPTDPAAPDLVFGGLAGLAAIHCDLQPMR